MTDSPALQHLCFPYESERGRRYPESSHPYRNDFQRDRDRIIRARAFRRLEDKTQVFTGGLSDHFRNRLTHTIEVAQIAGTVAAALGLNQDLTEALALSHDIGHPPFGHAGEVELNRLMKPFGDRFDHNLHSLRIVETFENSYARFPGLNLTFEVREGIVKHSRDFGRGDYPELDEYLPGVRPPLEAQLIDLCDEIAYDASDLDDSYAAGLVTVAGARGATPFFAELDEQNETQYPAAPERIRMHENVRGLINWLVTGLLEGTLEAASKLKSVEEVRHHSRRVAHFTPATLQATKDLKRFLRETVYQSEAVESSRRESTRKISKLFHVFLEDPSRLPANYREDSQGQPLHRQVCDYIAGMTDGFFLRTCQQMGVK
jgi:dGTPase